MFSIDKSRFGAFVSSLRKEKGITQKELADKLYVSDKAVSKWETGRSIPDVALLMPLAEILGVTVTELLECHRIDNPQPLPAEAVETIVKKAVTYQEFETEKGKLNKKWLVPYCICALLSIGQLICIRYIFAINSPIYASIQTVVVLSSVLGGYFCLFAKDRLPDYYDENKISFYSDGPFRMNVLGVHFNNHNWHHIIHYIRLWTLISMAMYVLISVFSISIFIYLGNVIDLYIPEVALASVSTLVILVFSLVIPVYFIGKKYE